MRGDARLVEDDRSIGVDARRQQGCGHFDRVLRQFGRHDGLGQRVQIGKEEQRVAVGVQRILHRHPLFDRAEIIAEVQVSGGLDARDDTHQFVSVGVAGLRRISAFRSAGVKARVAKQAMP